MTFILIFWLYMCYAVFQKISVVINIIINIHTIYI